MRYLSIIMVLVFFTTVLSASHFRSIRVGSFFNKADAEKSLIKLNKYIQTKKNIIHFQKKMFFKAKVIKVGRYYMNVIEPFQDNKKALQEIVDTIRDKYPHAYIKKIKGKAPVFKHPKPIIKKKEQKKVEVKEMKKVVVTPVVEDVEEPIVVEKKEQKEVEVKEVKKVVVIPVVEDVEEPITVEKIKPKEVEIKEVKKVVVTPVVEDVEEPIVVEEIKATKELNESIIEPIEKTVMPIENTLIEEVVIEELKDMKVLEKKDLKPSVVEVEEKEVEEAAVEVEEKEVEEAVVEVEEAVVEVDEKEIEKTAVKIKENRINRYLNSLSIEIKITFAILVALFFIMLIVVLFLLKKISNLKKLNIVSVDTVEAERLDELTSLETEITSLKTEYENRLQQLTQTHQEEIATIEDRYTRKMGAMNLKNEESLNQLLLTHQNDLEELTVSNKDKISKIKAIYENKIQKINATHEATVNDLKEQLVKPIEQEVVEILEPKIENSQTIEIVKEEQPISIQIEEVSEELTSSIGLGNCDGDEQFYNTILTEFKTNYKESPLTFEKLCNENNFEDARHLAGDIKDLAVNIGAYNLCESVASMEYDFEKGSTTNWKKLVENYKEKLEKLIIEIDDYTNKN